MAREAASRGVVPPITFERSGERTIATSRIDYVLLNTKASLALTGCETFPVCGVAGHRCVAATLDMEVFKQTTLQFRVPKALPSVTPDECSRVRPADLTAFYSHVRYRRVTEAWEVLSRTCEGFLLDAANVTEKRAAYSGRGEVREPKSRTLMTRSSHETGKPMTEYELRLDSAVRKLETYVRGLTALDGPGALPRELVNTWKNCSALASELASKAGRPLLSLDPPNESVARDVLGVLRKHKNMLVRARCQDKRSAYLESFTRDFSTDRRKLVTWLTSKRELAADALARADGTLTANVAEMDGILQKAWDPILRMYSRDKPEPQFGPFKAEYGRYMAAHPMGVKDITGEDLREVLRRAKKKKQSTSCGVDGWRIHELDCLPDSLLEGFAAFFNLVEKTGTWPPALQNALVTLIPKSESTAPTDLRPITVTSVCYRLWACRRLRDIVIWQELWALHSQHGFRPKHRAEDIVMDVATLIEDTLLDDGKELYLVALDFQKCFDRVPQQLVLDLAEHMGLSQRILQPLRCMYALLRRRFKTPLGVGESFEVTNGILQGCPISVILINALLCVILGCVEESVDGIDTSSYADDANIISVTSEADIQRAMDLIGRFCDLTGMKLNIRKTVLLGVRKGCRNDRARDPYVGSVTTTDDDGDVVTFPTTSRHKLLGYILSTSYAPEDHTSCDRISAMLPACSKLADAHLPFTARCTLATTAINTNAFYGCSTTYVPPKLLDDFTGKLTTGVFGRKHRARNRIAVLTCLNKGHLMDPVTLISYSTLRSLFDTCQRLPHLQPRLSRILHKHKSTPQPIGPVGLAMLRTPSDAIVWAAGGHDIAAATCASSATPLAAMTPGKRNHELRDMLRTKRWAELSESRPTYAGVEVGVDTARTNLFRVSCKDNALRNASTLIIAGAFHRGGRWKPVRLCDARDDPELGLESDSDCEDSADAPTDCDSDAMSDTIDTSLCPHCMDMVEDTCEHLWWHCSAFAEIRSEPRFSAVMSADRTAWPPCLRNWGVITRGANVDAVALHLLMSTILCRRIELGATAVALPPCRPHAWRRAMTLPTSRSLCDPRRILAHIDLWTYATDVRCLAEWACSLRWCSDPGSEISMIELAIDFEVSSGCLLRRCAQGPPLGINERGKLLRTMLRALSRVCAAAQMADLVPASRVKLCTSLRTLNGPTVSGGYSPRALLQDQTMSLLECQLVRTQRGMSDKGWKQIVPCYAGVQPVMPRARSTNPLVHTPLQRRPKRPRIPAGKPAAKAARSKRARSSISSDDDAPPRRRRCVAPVKRARNSDSSDDEAPPRHRPRINAYSSVNEKSGGRAFAPT